MFSAQRKKILGLALLMMFLFTTLMIGCSSSPTPGEKTSENKTSGDTKSKTKTFTVGVVLASSTNPLYVSMNKGIQDKAKELGVNIRSVIADEDQTRQNNGIQDLITAKVDALLVSPITLEGAIPAYESAKEAGIPVISIARTLKRQDIETTYVGMDIVQDGRNIGEWLAKKLNGKGKVAMLKGVAGASFTMDLEKGFKEAIAKYPEIKIVGEVNSAITKEQGLKNTENFLTANPQLDAIYAANDELALGSLQAVETAGRLNKILITGYNGTPPGLAAVKGGKMTVTTVLRPYGWGQLGIQTVFDVLNGKTAPNPVAHETKLVDQEILKNINPDELK